MGKIINIFVLFLTMLLFTAFGLAKVILANHTADDNRISVSHSPNPVFADSGKVNFEIKATNGLDFPTGAYQYRILIPGRNECTVSKAFRSNDPKTILVQDADIEKNAPCANIFGVRTFKLDLLSGIGGPSVEEIIKNYTFDVLQPGGGKTPQLIALNENFRGRDMPEVQIDNVKNGTTYSLWWDGAGGFGITPGFGPIATRFRASSDGASGKLVIPKTGVDFNKDEAKTLCMEIGDYPFVYPSIPCKYKTIFHYTIFAPPPTPVQPTCSISPSQNLTENQSVSVIAEKLPKNKNFRAALIEGNNIIPLSLTQNSGDSGIVSLPLAASLKFGSNYAAEVYDNTTGNLACGESFAVGSTSSPTSPPQCIPQGGGKFFNSSTKMPCAVSGEVSCDINSNKPGIKTAIGCIHTNPADLVQDVLKFSLGIGGGLAFLMMLLGAFQMLTSAGNPETLQAGKDRLTSAVIGLLFIIFAVLLLQIIGVDILGILKR